MVSVPRCLFFNEVHCADKTDRTDPPFNDFASEQAVTGLPEPRADHAVAMSQFALDCLDRMHVLVKKLEVHLGPDTGT